MQENAQGSQTTTEKRTTWPRGRLARRRWSRHGRESARQILDGARARDSSGVAQSREQQGRPKEELDYLDRLLKEF